MALPVDLKVDLELLKKLHQVVQMIWQRQV